MRVKSVKVRNFKSLCNVEMHDVPNFAVLVGANGAGKSTFIDIFGFLKDCLVHNVRSAVQKRAGFRQLVSRGNENGTIEIELKVELDFEKERKTRTVTYILHIAEENGRPIVEREILRFRRRGNKGKPFHFIDMERGEGEAVEETSASFDTGVSYEDLKREAVSLDSPDILAIKALGQFRRFEAASQFRELIEGWTVSDFRIDDARIEPDAAPAEHLNEKGDNLALYAQHLHQNHPEVFESLLREMPRRVPGIAKIGPEETEDGRVMLRFEDPAFKRGFIARAVSDGTIKMFAYLALLADPHPHPLLCIEEPENQLYPTLLSILAEEFAEYASRRSSGAQVFVTTHSPDFLSAVPINSVYWLEKRDGYASIRRAANDAELCKMAKKGQKLGWLWRQGWFKGADP